MRVTTDFFVSALVRAAQEQGCFATVVRKGVAEAGAVFIIERSPQGRLALYTPAMQLSYASDETGDRLFELRAPSLTEADIDQFIEREERIDPDFWVVELEGSLEPLPFSVVDAAL